MLKAIIKHYYQHMLDKAIDDRNFVRGIHLHIPLSNLARNCRSYQIAEAKIIYYETRLLIARTKYTY